jgi:restriction system protein
MAQSPNERRGELVRGVFEILQDHPQGRQAADVLRELEQRLPPTDHEASTFPRHPTVRRFEKIVRFATINAVKAGWLVKEKGTWSLTEDGLQALETFKDPVVFYSEAVKGYKEWAKRQAPPASEEDAEAEAEDQAAGAVTALEEAEEAAWSEIRDYLGSMAPYEFQDLVGDLLRAMGYHVMWTAPPGPDRGIDLIAYNDPLGTSSPRMLVQVKRQPGTKTTADGLRSFMAVLGDRDVGIFISAGGFTSEAEREARSQERRRLTLIDLNRLVELWIEHFDRLDDASRRKLPMKPVYFLSPPT